MGLSHPWDFTTKSNINRLQGFTLPSSPTPTYPVPLLQTWVDLAIYYSSSHPRFEGTDIIRNNKTFAPILISTRSQRLEYPSSYLHPLMNLSYIYGMVNRFCFSLFVTITCIEQSRVHSKASQGCGSAQNLRCSLPCRLPQQWVTWSTATHPAAMQTRRATSLRSLALYVHMSGQRLFQQSSPAVQSNSPFQ